jgi:LuxR family maltose regulon positive regulatory protein
MLWAIWALAVGGFTDRARLWVIELSQNDREPMLGEHERAIVETLLASIDDDVDRGLAHMAPFLDAGDAGLTPPMAGLRANCLRWINQQVGAGLADPVAPPDEVIQEIGAQEVYRYCMTAFRHANILLDRGRSHEAIRFLEPARAVAEKQGGPASVPLQIVSSALAFARRQHGDGIAARLALAACRHDAARLAIPDVLWLTRSTTARLAADGGDWPDALNVLSGLEAEARGRALPRLVALSLADSARILVRAGRQHCMEAPLMRLQEVHGAAGALGPVQQRLVRLAADIGIAHAASALGQTSVAEAALEEAWSLAALHRRRHDLAEISLLSAHVARSDRVADAIDESDRRRLLQDIGQRGAPQGATIATPASVPIPALTAKETEIIELLSAGLSNKRIAEAMLVSAETVKWHLKNIFNKLDVHDREHVIAYARDFVARR